MTPSLLAETEALTRSLERRQKAVTEGQYLQTTMRVLNGAGTNGPKARPYKQELSVLWFSGLVYALTMLNANAFAKVPIRLYVKSQPGRQKAFRTKALSRKQRAWLMGEKHVNSRHAPSLAVQRKAAEYGEVEEVVDAHPITELLRTANPWQNGFELSKLRSIQLQVTGNAYLWPEVDNRIGRPTQLWMVPSQYTKVVPGTDGRYIDGYEYGPPQAPRRFGPDELINWKMPGIDPMAYYGYGRVQAAWEAINLRKGERMTSQAMYDNGARPDWALIWKSGASKPDMDRVDAAIESKFRGPNKAGNFLTVSGDVDIKPLQWAPKDMGTNEDVENEICNIWGTPLTKVRSMDPNRSNGETSDAGWLRDTILPDLRFDEEQLNARYVPLFGEFEDGFLCYDDPVPENEGETREGVIAEGAAGIRTHNECRSELGLEPSPQDFIVLPKGTTALKVGEDGSIGDPLYEPEPVQTSSDSGGDAPPKKKVVKKVSRSDTITAYPDHLLIPVGKVSIRLTSSEGWGASTIFDVSGMEDYEILSQSISGPHSATITVDGGESFDLGTLVVSDGNDRCEIPVKAPLWVPIAGFELARGLLEAFRRQRQLALATMSREAEIDASTPPKPPVLAPTVPLLATLAVQFLRQAYAEGANRVSKQLGVKLPSVTPARESTVVNDMARVMVQQINDTTTRRLTDAIRTEWNMHGSRAEAVRAAVDAVLGPVVSEMRADVIAEHQTLTAQERGGEEAARLLNIKHRVYWTLGPRPCIRCVRIHNAYPDGIEGGTNFKDPVTGQIVRPGEVHPRCQCVTRYRRVE